MTNCCKIFNCTAPIPSDRLMCVKHWRMVPKDLQRDVWRQYRAGDARPSIAYLNATKAAVQAVEAKLLKRAEKVGPPQLF